MKTVRSSVFETNSSSCHSITFCKDNKPVKWWPVSDFRTLRMSAEKDFYGGGEFNDPLTKAMYFSDALAAYISRERSLRVVDFYEKLGSVTEKDLIEGHTKSAKEMLVDRKNHEGEPIKDEIWKNALYNYSDELKAPEIESDIKEILSQIKDSIEGYFENEGVKVIWSDSDLGKDWTETLEPLGAIDHQSSIYEDPNCEKLAKLFMDVPKLYEWIMSKDGSLYLDTDG